MSDATKLSHRFWQLGAGLVEAYSPILWKHVDDAIREREAQMRANGDPIVWLVDEKQVYGVDRGSKGRRKLLAYSVLVVAELDWTDELNSGATKLRLLRAMPSRSTPAWRLVFDELGIVPDVVVSDAADAIKNAVATHYAARPPLHVPSLYHISKSLREGILSAAFDGPLKLALFDHLAELSRDGAALTSVPAWTTWWDDLEAMARASGVVSLPSLQERRAAYEGMMAASLPALLSNPKLKYGTGGVESLIQGWVDPMLHRRGPQFGNIVRTNRLWDLVVCRSEGLFASDNAVADLLVADAEPHGGWTVPMRQIADPAPSQGIYASLHDVALLNALAEQYGVA